MSAFDPASPEVTADQAATERLGPFARAMAAFNNLLAGDMQGEVTLRASASPSP